MQATTAAPEQGQLVQVRSRPWVVNVVKPSSLPSPAMELPVAKTQNLLTLSSVEDDGLGEVAGCLGNRAGGQDHRAGGAARTDRFRWRWNSSGTGPERFSWSARPPCKSSGGIRWDSKVKQLVAWLKEQLKPGGKWSNERVIIFTEYRATRHWLQEVLSVEGFTEGGRLLTMYGGIDSEKREEVKAAFQTAPEISPVRILLGTDAA